MSLTEELKSFCHYSNANNLLEIKLYTVAASRISLR